MVSNLLAEVLNAEAPNTTLSLIYTANQRQLSALFCPILMVLLSSWLRSKRRAPKQEDDWEHPEFPMQNLFPLKQTILIQSKNSREERGCLQTPGLGSFHGSRQTAERSGTCAVDNLVFWPKESEMLIHFLNVAKC